jgi:hypothetical protein
MNAIAHIDFKQLTLAFVLCSVCMVHAGDSQVADVKQDSLALSTASDDAFAREFVSRVGGECASYDGKQLILYASPSAILTIFIGEMGIAGLALGGEWIRSALPQDDKKDSQSMCYSCKTTVADRIITGSIGVFMATAGAWACKSCIERVIKHLRHVPYFTLNAEGLRLYDRLAFKWDEVTTIDRTSGIVQGKDVINMVQFKNKYGSSLLDVVADKYNLVDQAAISMGHFFAIATQYHEKYGKHA